MIKFSAGILCTIHEASVTLKQHYHSQAQQPLLGGQCWMFAQNVSILSTSTRYKDVLRCDVVKPQRSRLLSQPPKRPIINCFQVLKIAEEKHKAQLNNGVTFFFPQILLADYFW